MPDYAGGVTCGGISGCRRREEAIDTPKRHATHETHAAHAIPCNGAPGRWRRQRFFRGKKGHAAGVDRTDPPSGSRAGGCEPFNCKTPGSASSYAHMHATLQCHVIYNPIVTFSLGIRPNFRWPWVLMSLLYSCQSQRDQSNRPNKFQINKIMTKTRSPVWFFTGPLSVTRVGCLYKNV